MTTNSWNSDIPVTVANGGTGAVTLTGIITGAGTGALTANTVTEGAVLLGGSSNSVTDTGVLAKGTLLVGDGTTAPTELTVGANDTILTADSAEASGIKWAAAGGSGGAWTYISAITLSNDATAEFTSGIDSTYDTYVFVFTNVLPATNDVRFRMRTSTDGGTTFDATAGNYAYDQEFLSSDNTAWNNFDSASSSLTNIAGSTTADEGVGNDSKYGGVSGQLYLFDPSGTTAHTQWSGVMEYGNENAGNTVLSTTSCRRLATADVDAVQFYCSSGNMTSGVIRMYGINNS